MALQIAPGSHYELNIQCGARLLRVLQVLSKQPQSSKDALTDDVRAHTDTEAVLGEGEGYGGKSSRPRSHELKKGGLRGKKKNKQSNYLIKKIWLLTSGWWWLPKGCGKENHSGAKGTAWGAVCHILEKWQQERLHNIFFWSHKFLSYIEPALDMTESLEEFAAVYKSKANVNNVCCRRDADHTSLTLSSFPSFKLNQCSTSFRKYTARRPQFRFFQKHVPHKTEWASSIWFPVNEFFCGISHGLKWDKEFVLDTHRFSPGTQWDCVWMCSLEAWDVVLTEIKYLTVLFP